MNFETYELSETESIESAIANAKRENSKVFDFRNINEKDNFIPDDFFDLTELEEVILGSKLKLSSLPDKILRLRKLKVIEAHNPDLTEFPVHLGELPNLNSLLLNNASFKSIPKEISNWTKLTYLNLNKCNQLDAIENLPSNLEYLHIGHTALKTIPESFFQLKKVNKLVAVGLNLKFLPRELYNSSSLVSLFVGQNDLSTIPNDIEQLKNLTQIWLDGNLFTEFPTALLHLKKLRTINLRHNGLKKIPASIKQLTHLTDLDLGSNRFTSIPRSIFNLKSLTSLSFGNYYGLQHKRDRLIGENLIKLIPEAILDLPNLKKLDLYKNKIRNIPVEILDKGLDEIKNYLVSKKEADSEELLYEAKMVMVGRGNVGKTVLTQKLTNPNYSLTQNKSTLGISILKNPFLFPMKGLKNNQPFRFTVWDFGGQEKYDATHQLFITNRSIYLFLTEAREESNYLDFYYWLNTIRLFSDNSPVIVVLSKYDERKKLLPESIYKRQFENIVDFVDVSCANGFEHTIVRLKDAIKKAILLLPQTQQKLSNHWVDIRNTLENLSLTKDYITYEEYLKVCKKHKLDKKRADFLSQYLNDLGVIIHHKNDLLLRKTVFIKTDWCVDGMYKVLDDEQVVGKAGRFTIKDLEVIWKENRFKNKQIELLKLMNQYDLCFELKDGSGFVVPELLRPDQPVNLKWTFDSNLRFEYKYEFMPAGIISRFIVKCHGFIKESLLWKYGVVLEYDKTTALIEEDYINGKIKISIVGENKRGLLSAIRMYIEEVHKDFDKANKLIYEEMVPCNCPTCQINKKPHFYKFNVLKMFNQKNILEVPCEISSSSVKIKSLIDDVQLPDISKYLDSNEDLKRFITKTIYSILQKEILLKGGYINFWRDPHCKIAKNETEFQPYISNTLDNFCKINGVQLSREVSEANGHVDILFSHTNRQQQVLKVCVEIKKAHHQDIESGLKNQLTAYMESSGTDQGIYLVIWMKNKHLPHPLKYSHSNELLNKLKEQTTESIDVILLDCTRKNAPSKKRT